MTLSPADNDSLPTGYTSLWNRPSPAAITTMDDGLAASATRRVVREVRDADGFAFPLLRELALTVYPHRGSQLWRAECDAVGPDVVGHGGGARQAIADWQRRFASAVSRLLEVRPFEMTADDRQFFAKVLGLIDLGEYRATKPYEVRQVGQVLKHLSRPKGNLVVVRWEDGTVERVNPLRFDEPLHRYPMGQLFEALVVRHPITTAVLRSYALRKVAPTPKAAADWSERVWERAVRTETPQREPDEIDRAFWNIDAD